MCTSFCIARGPRYWASAAMNGRLLGLKKGHIAWCCHEEALVAWGSEVCVVPCYIVASGIINTGGGCPRLRIQLQMVSGAVVPVPTAMAWCVPPTGIDPGTTEAVKLWVLSFGRQHMLDERYDAMLIAAGHDSLHTLDLSMEELTSGEGPYVVGEGTAVPRPLAKLMVQGSRAILAEYGIAPEYAGATWSYRCDLARGP